MDSRLLSLLVAGGLFFTACTNEADIFGDKGSPKTDVTAVLTAEEARALSYAMNGSFVSKDDAMSKASNALERNVTKAVTNGECEVYWVKYHPQKKQTALRSSVAADTDSIPLYIINYKDGGGAIVSGDNRLPEILAFSETGRVSLELTGTGADVFIEHLPLFVEQKINEFEAKQDSLLNLAENKTGINLLAASVPISRIEDETTPWVTKYDYNHMVKVKWEQGYPYNGKFPSVTENGKTLSHAVAGCTTIAVAQILSYHKYPSSFDGLNVNWSGLTASASINDLGITYQEQLQNLLLKIAI